MTIAWRVLGTVAIVAWSIGCTAHADSTDRWYQPAYVAAGAPLYQQYCASCHGVNAEGAANWQRPNPDGNYPAPPLNGSGHAWHHPLSQLHAMIMNGSPSGTMPPWRSTLTTAQVLAIIAWFQAQWSDEIYMAWARMNDAASKQDQGSRGEARGTTSGAMPWHQPSH